MDLADVRPIDAASAEEVLGARGSGRDGLRAPDRPRGARGGACARAGGSARERASGHTGRRRERAGRGATVEVTRPEGLSADGRRDRRGARVGRRDTVRRATSPCRSACGVVDRSPDAGPAIARLRAMGSTSRWSPAIGPPRPAPSPARSGSTMYSGVDPSRKSMRGPRVRARAAASHSSVTASTMHPRWRRPRWVAIGSSTDVALAAADVNLLGPGLIGVPVALELARRTYRIIQQNLFWAFAQRGDDPRRRRGDEPMWAAAAMAASSVSVVANACGCAVSYRERARSMDAMEHVIEVTDETFDQVVVEGSDRSRGGGPVGGLVRPATPSGRCSRRPRPNGPGPRSPDRRRRPGWATRCSRRCAPRASRRSWPSATAAGQHVHRRDPVRTRSTGPRFDPCRPTRRSRRRRPPTSSPPVTSPRPSKGSVTRWRRGRTTARRPSLAKILLERGAIDRRGR